jgi:hypothetical protein
VAHGGGLRDYLRTRNLPGSTANSTELLSQLPSEFDDFLYAPIGEDGNGMPLSVLSALARLDLDPWQEAAQLAALPGKAALQRLASLMAALPDGSMARPNSGAIAARLIVLLPRQASFVPLHEALIGRSTVSNSPSVVRIIVYAICVMMISAPWIMASRHLLAPVDKAHPPASTTISPHTPPPSSGHSRGDGLG